MCQDVWYDVLVVAFLTAVVLWALVWGVVIVTDVFKPCKGKQDAKSDE